MHHLTIRRGATPAALDLLFPDNAGGGLLSRGTLILTTSTLSGNSAFVGGGLAAVGGTVTCRASTLSHNYASEGGGLAAVDSTVTVLNSTVSDNNACGGGGLTVLDSIVTVTDSTVRGNLARIGSGILNAGTVTYTNTILADDAECPATAQRGVPRLQDSAADGRTKCDVGACAVTGAPAYAGVVVINPCGMRDVCRRYYPEWSPGR